MISAKPALYFHLLNMTFDSISYLAFVVQIFVCKQYFLSVLSVVKCIISIFFICIRQTSFHICVKKARKCQPDDWNKKVETFKINNNLLKKQTKKKKIDELLVTTLCTHTKQLFFLTRKRNGNILQYQSPRLLVIINIFSDSWIFPPHFWIIKKKHFHQNQAH